MALGLSENRINKNGFLSTPKEESSSLVEFKIKRLNRVNNILYRFRENLLSCYRNKTPLSQYQITVLATLLQRYYTIITDEAPSTFQQHYVPKTKPLNHILTNMITGEITSIEDVIVDDKQKFNKKIIVPYQLFPVIHNLRVKLPYSNKEQNRAYFDILQKQIMPLFGFFKTDLLRYFKNNRPDINFHKLKSALSTEVDSIVETNIPKKFYNYLYPILINTYDEKEHLKLAHWVYYCLHSINEFSKSKLDAKEQRHLLYKNKVKNNHQFWTLSQIRIVLKKFNPKISDHQVKIALEACDKFNLIEKMNDRVLDKKTQTTYRVLSSNEIFEDRSLHLWDEDKPKFYGKCFNIQFDKKNWMPSSPDQLIYQLLMTDLDRACMTSYKTINYFWGLSNHTISQKIPEICHVKHTYSVIATIKTDYNLINLLYQNNNRLRFSKSKDGYTQVYQVEANRHHSKIAYHVCNQTYKPKLTQTLKWEEDKIPKSIKRALENSTSPKNENIQPSYIVKEGKPRKGHFVKVPLVKKQDVYFEVKTNKDSFFAKNTKRFIPSRLDRDDIFNNPLPYEEITTEIEISPKGHKQEVRQIVEKKSVPTKKQILTKKAKESLKPKTLIPHTQMIVPTKSFPPAVLGKIKGLGSDLSLAIANKELTKVLSNRSDHC